MSEALPAILPYASSADASVPRGRHPLLRLLLLAPALPLCFVSFTYHISPLDAAVEGLSDWHSDSLTLGLLGPPFFVGPLLFLRQLWCLLLRPRRHVLRRATLAASVLFHADCLLLFTLVARDMAANGIDAHDTWSFAVAALAYTAGLVATALAWRRDRDTAALSALATPFVAIAGLCLIAFHDDPQPGYYLTAYLLPLTVADLALRLRKK